VRVRELYRLYRLGERADLVHLDEDRVGDTPLDALLQPLRIRHEDVVADQLDALAEVTGQGRPGVPVVLGATVLDRDDRVRVDDPLPEAGHLRPGEVAPLEAVATVSVHLACRGVERDRDALPVP